MGITVYLGIISSTKIVVWGKPILQEILFTHLCLPKIAEGRVLNRQGQQSGDQRHGADGANAPWYPRHLVGRLECRGKGVFWQASFQKMVRFFFGKALNVIIQLSVQTSNPTNVRIMEKMEVSIWSSIDSESGCSDCGRDVAWVLRFWKRGSVSCHIPSERFRFFCWSLLSSWVISWWSPP